MMHSMTGYSNATAQFGGHQISIELRALNHRYLDIQFRIADEIRYLENQLREMITSHITRGKFECRIQLQPIAEQQQKQLELNQPRVNQLISFNHQLRKKHQDIGKLTVADILKFPGVIVTPSVDKEALAADVMNLLQQALQEFNQVRAREGHKLQQHLLHRLTDIDDIVTAVQQLFPQLLQQYMDKAEARLREAVAQVDGDRLKQEFVLFMQKTDIDEELNRLQTHLAEVRRLITEHKGSVGKRLDFLMQELNREANTLGSKAIATECSQAAVGLKVLIEQMREQIQNIE